LTRGAAERLALSLVITAVVLAAGITKIADLDFWWQLKAGQLVVTTHSIPRTDVFSYTAFGHEYIDHEWLFQVTQYAAWSVAGPLGIALLKCLIVAATLVLVALYAVRCGTDAMVAGGLTLLAIAGGITRIIERPELFSTLFAVIAFVLADSYLRTRDWRFLVPLPLLCALWANVHAAVVVGLIIQILFVRSMPQIAAFAASVGAACLNPFGYRVLTVPFELTRIIDSGLLNNEEWRHPTLIKTPFYFVALGITIGLFAVFAGRSRAEARGHTGARVLVAIFLAYISLKYIRNVGLFCTFVPLLIGEEASRLHRRVFAALGAISVAIILTVYFPFEHGIGEASYFPDGIVRFVKQRDLRGHMLNSYSFGGYLIWNLFPERRVFIDGRNEVYLPLLERLKVAKTDSRAWNALLHDEQIEYALLEYVDDLDRVTTFDSSGKTKVGFAPITVTRLPRARWALVYWDDDGMVFVKRNGANAITGEYTSVFPEGRRYQHDLVARGTIDRSRAVAELQRKIAEDPSCRRAKMLLASVTQNR
jgi:hypothetical protein